MKQEPCIDKRRMLVALLLAEGEAAMLARGVWRLFWPTARCKSATWHWRCEDILHSRPAARASSGGSCARRPITWATRQRLKSKAYSNNSTNLFIFVIGLLSLLLQILRLVWCSDSTWAVLLPSRYCQHMHTATRTRIWNIWNTGLFSLLLSSVLVFASCLQVSLQYIGQYACPQLHPSQRVAISNQ